MKLCIVTDARGREQAFHPNLVAQIVPVEPNKDYPDSKTLLKFKEVDGRANYAYMKESVRELATFINSHM